MPSSVDTIVAGVQHAVPPQPHKGPLKGSGPGQGKLYDLIAPRFKDWKTAAGIAWAESKFDPNARSHNPDGGENRGLFQIDTKTAAHTIDPQTGHPLNPDWLFIPSYNVYAAWLISKHGTDWHPWATAFGKDGTYLGSDAPFRKAPGSATNVPSADSGFLGTGVGSPADIGSPLDAIKAIWNTLSAPKTWLRVLYFIGGLALGYFALRQLAAAATQAA